MQVDLNSWQHIAIEGAVYLIPTLGAGYLAFRRLVWVLGEFRPHNHTERLEDDNLKVGGIQYPRHFNGRS